MFDYTANMKKIKEFKQFAAYLLDTFWLVEIAREEPKDLEVMAPIWAYRLCSLCLVAVGLCGWMNGIGQGIFTTVLAFSGFAMWVYIKSQIDGHL
jgi:hypothetical protein